MIVLSVLLGALAAVLLLPTLSDVVSLVRWLFVRPRRTVAPEALPSPLPRLLFLVPAHNESLLVGHTIESLLSVDYPEDRRSVVVIADNCTDDTAGIARAAGAACLERFDEQRRGKPWALHWALGVLPIAKWDAVIVLDADTVVDRQFCNAIAAAGPLRHRAFQTYNDVANPGDSALTRMAAVFAASRFHLINGLKERAALNVPLVNGLIIGTDVLAEHGWRAFSICEDWEMYAMLTAAGVEIRNLPGARNLAQEAKSLAQAGPQRQRWAAGKITVLAEIGPALLRSRRVGAAQKLDALAELIAPGPVVLGGVSVALIAFFLIVRPPGWQLLAAAFAIPNLRNAAYTLAALPAVDEPYRALGAFLFLVFYAPWRVLVQMRAVRLVRNARWIRTERHLSVPNGAKSS